jgi:hypothetical protein
MRQLSPLTNLMLAVLASVGVVVTLGLPWYATDSVLPNDPATGIESAAAAIARWFTSDGATISGTEALQKAESGLLLVCGMTALLSMLVLAGPIRNYLRGPLKLVALSAPVIVTIHLFHQPVGEELRWGTFVALAASLLLANAAYHGAEIRDPRPAPLPYQPPPPPTASSVSPPKF